MHPGFGLGSGADVLVFEDPIILKRNIRFIARIFPPTDIRFIGLKTDESVVPKHQKHINISNYD